MDEKTIINIGELEGHVLLFGGVYSNLQALEALIDFATSNDIKPGNCIHTGDIVGYCGQPNECVELMNEWGCRSILGNVEIQLVNGEEDCACDFTKGSRCDVLSNQWYPLLQKQITEQSIHYFTKLPNHIIFSIGGLRVGIVHGSYENTSEFIFQSTAWDRKESNYSELNVDIVIAGHCGLPFYQKNESNYWINPGVIGMPANNGKNETWFSVLHVKNQEVMVEYHELDYDYKKAMEMMAKNQYPKAYAKTLHTGIWDNMDILPHQEKKQKGKLIEVNPTV